VDRRWWWGVFEVRHGIDVVEAWSLDGGDMSISSNMFLIEIVLIVRVFPVVELFLRRRGSREREFRFRGSGKVVELVLFGVQMRIKRRSRLF
jgi:hypothetical protein